MDIKHIEQMVQSRDGIRLITTFAACVVVVVLFFFVLVRPQGIAVRRVKSDMEKIEQLAAQYKDFNGAFAAELDSRRNTVTAMLGQDDTAMAESEQGALEYIGKKAGDVHIQVERLTPIQNQSDAQKKWDINFRANYGSLVQFMMSLENAFKIEHFQVNGGGARNIHAVSMTLSLIPLPVGENPAALAKKDIFTIVKEVDAWVTDITAHQRKRIPDVFARDPLFYPDTIFPVVRVAEPKSSKNEMVRPPLGIEDIFWDPEMPLVSIEGRVLKTGDSIRGIDIIKIREKSIDVKWKSNIFTYEFQKKGG